MGRDILKHDDLYLDISYFDLDKISRSTSRIPDLRSLKLSGDRAPVSMDVRIYVLSIHLLIGVPLYCTAVWSREEGFYRDNRTSCVPGRHVDM